MYYNPGEKRYIFSRFSEASIYPGESLHAAGDVSLKSVQVSSPGLHQAKRNMVKGGFWVCVFSVRVHTCFNKLS